MFSIECLLRRIMPVLLALSMCLTASTASSETSSQTYVVVGTENIVKENITDARKQAIINTLVTAVGLSVAEMLPVDVMVAQNEKLNQFIYDNQARFIQDYKVLTESRLENRYRVVVQATVSGSRVKSELTRTGMLLAQKRMPAVLFLILEQNLESPFPQYWWGRNMPYVKPASEMAIAEAMREQDFRIVEHGPQTQTMAQQSVTDAPVITVEEAVNLGKLLRADVVVIGRAVAESAPNTLGTATRSYKATIMARAYRTTTGTEIAAINKTAVTANVDDIAGSRDALRGAGSLSGEELATQIAAAWQQEGLAAGKIDILLSGTRNLANFVQFRRMLSSLPGVEDIQVKELMADDASLRIAYRGKTKELADAMMLHAFDTFGINIFEVTQDTMKIQLIPNTPGSPPQ